MGNINQTLDDFSDRLRKDLDAAKKARVMTTIIGAVLFLVVFFVFMSLAGALKDNVRPDTMAETVNYAVRESVKSVRPMVEKSLKDNIPAFLKGLRQSLINDLIPTLRQEIEVELQNVIEKSYLNSSRAFTDAVRVAVKEVKPLADEQGDPTPEVLANLIQREFDKEKKKRYTDRPEETLGAQFEQSKEMLEGLNKKLMQLTRKKRPGSREEALEMKFLRAWVSLISPGQESNQPPGLDKLQ